MINEAMDMALEQEGENEESDKLANQFLDEIGINVGANL